MNSPFNDYNEKGYRVTRSGSLASKVEDEAIIRNLRFRWGTELTGISDTQLLNEYNDFALSDWFGNNDENFLEWIRTSLED